MRDQGVTVSIRPGELFTTFDGESATFFVTTDDLEIQRLGAIVALLGELSDDQRHRIVRYLSDRYDTETNRT